MRTVIEATLALSADQWAPPAEGLLSDADAIAAKERMVEVFAR